MAKKRAGSSERQEDTETTSESRPYRMAFAPGADLDARIRNYVYWERASLNQFLIEAATREIERLEKELHGGKAWPARKGVLKPGRKPS